jgi:hypothetical protein
MMPSSRNRRTSKDLSNGRTFPNCADAAGFVAEAVAAASSVIEPLEGRVLMAITPVDAAITAALAASPHAVTVGVAPWRTPPIGVTTPPPPPVGAPNIAAGKARVVFNDVRGGAATGNVSLPIQNTGDQPLTITGASLAGADAGMFTITGQPGGTVAPGASTTMTFTFSAPTGTGLGVKSAQVNITSNDPDGATLSVPLRGLATAGVGGQNEPSLQRIFDLYELGIATGDANPGNTNLFSNAEPLGNSEEISLQRMAKAGDGPVTITPLGVFAGGTPSVRFGYYPAGSAGNKTEVLTVPSPDQTVNPVTTGNTSFDPGGGSFGLYVTFPIFGNTAHSEDELNTAEANVANRRKVRFYPYEENGQVVANAYVMTSEDFINDPTGAYDTNDFIAIVRNVRPAALTGTSLSVQNLDGVPSNDRMVFSRVERPTGNFANKDKRPEFITPQSPERVKSVEVLPNDVKDTGTFRLTNDTPNPLTINSLTLTNGNWTFVERPADGTVLAPGQSANVTLRFEAHGLRAGHTGNETIDTSGRVANAAGSHTGTLAIDTGAPGVDRELTLAGWWQRENEKNMEPNLDVIVRKLFGYQTTTFTGGNIIADGRPTPIGDEVISAYWRRMDNSRPVTVRQLVAYHGQAPVAADPELFAQPTDAAQFGYFNKGSRTVTRILNHDPNDGQSVLPSDAGRPSAGSFNHNGVFGFHVGRPGNEWSDDSMNTRREDAPPSDEGHHMRFFPLKDASGAVVPGSYIVAMDYAALNFDFQDNVYLVTNIQPE